ncbi:MAG TPA: FprA family A-type flavoprotein, partial [Bacteroidetes bacterium]|nr:FprA family A-type flavoprotein [Bacteroidota bacterium]HEX04957.1 FprA family A-type flavoprotein [Bacteroidota bacterium]
MSSSFRAREVCDKVYAVGAIDWELAEFHGYHTPHGTTYNAYLILADKITLIDTVKAKYTDELLARISSVIHPSRIDYIVSNHSELDHSGALPKIIEAVQPEAVYASPKGVQALERHFHDDLKLNAVKDGDKLSLGNMELTFQLTSMVHWPDSMFSFLDHGKVLFSNDAFGMHVASSKLWADEHDPGHVAAELKNYYANILWLTSRAVQKVFKGMDKAEIEPSIILPDHGPGWRNNLEKPLGLYKDWSEGKKDPNKAVILFDTMWGSTALMARVIADGLIEGGMDVQVLPLAKTERAKVALECLDASLLIVGSPTLNGGLFPTIADVLTYISGLNPGKPRIKGAVFG